MSQVSRQWRSLEQLADDPSFVARVVQEFPSLADALAVPSDRRRVLKLMAAAVAMGGLSGCDIGEPEGHLTPAVRVPPNIIPGLPNFYSTANVVNGYAAGVVVKHQMGRPIKVEGNPQHPASLGATDVFAQAQVLDFYDLDRAAAITARNLPADRQLLETALLTQRTKIAADHGAGLRILTGTVTSPNSRQTARRAAYALSGGALAPMGAGLPRQHMARSRTRVRYAGRVRAEPCGRRCDLRYRQ